MDQNLTEIVCVLDKSGSMMAVRDDSIGSFNQFLKEQKEAPGKANFSLTLFDTEYHYVYSGEDIQNVSELDSNTYNPGGMTALLDAVGKTIDETGRRLAETPGHKRPGKVIFVILTDGQENSSKEYTFDIVKDKIEHQRNKYNWEFLFLGAGEDTIKQASQIGIGMDKTMSFSHSSKGYDTASKSYSSAVLNYRSVGDVGDNWKKDEDDS